MKLVSKITALLAILCSSSVVALPFSSVDPSTFGADIDGDGYFSHSGSVFISFEAYDAFDTDPSIDLEFGFFFEGDSGSLVTLFDSSESAFSKALIDFTDGGVLDLDDGLVEAVFTPSTADFGLFLSVVDTSTGSTSTVYSDPLLNGGVDLFGAFEFLIPDVPAGTLVGMFFTAPPGENGDLLYVAPLVSINEPETVSLFVLGFAMLLTFRRRSKPLPA